MCKAPLFVGRNSSHELRALFGASLRHFGEQTLIPNLITEADNLEEVIPNVSDALAALIETYEDLNQPLPSALQPLIPNNTLWTETLIPVNSTVKAK
ncbi:MAG: type II toxin-antitoxin system HicB family antitoxin [Crocosphaera sp.]|nr:type II toxin-antitoxin system HicB family antitoxin [Crocosphaera sp.]